VYSVNPVRGLSGASRGGGGLAAPGVTWAGSDFCNNTCCHEAPIAEWL